MNLVLIPSVPVRKSCAKSSASSPVLHSDTTLDKDIEHIQFVSKGLQSQFRNIRSKQLGWGEAKTVRHSPAVSRFLGRMDLLSSWTDPEPIQWAVLGSFTTITNRPPTVMRSVRRAMTLPSATSSVRSALYFRTSIR